jgi:hypothetical protein
VRARQRFHDLRALRQGGDVPDARSLALSRVRLQNGLLRLVMDRISSKIRTDSPEFTTKGDKMTASVAQLREPLA